MRAKTYRRKHVLKHELHQQRARAVADLVRQGVQPKMIAEELGIKAPAVSHYMLTLGCEPVYLFPEEIEAVRQLRSARFIVNQYGLKVTHENPAVTS